MDKLLVHTIAYLKATNPFFKIEPRGKVELFSCPICKAQSCVFIPNTYIMNCYACGKLGNLVDVIKNMKHVDDEAVFAEVRTVLGLNIVNENEQEKMVEFYSKNGFDLVPLVRGQKFPIEKEWPTKDHTNVNEWKDWITRGINIGVKTGARSNITVIDIDQTPIPDILLPFLADIRTLKLVTNKGFHFFFRYCSELPKTRIDELKMDIQNDGAQVVIPPSVVDGKLREFTMDEIIEIPEAFKKFLLSRVRGNKVIDGLPDYDPEKGFVFKPEAVDWEGGIKEGNRHNMFMHLGGILRNEMNMEQTQKVLSVFNRYFCKPSLDNNDFSNVIRMLGRYDNFDEKELAGRVLSYMKIVEEANARDVRDALGFKKELIDRVLNYLVKEGYLYKKRAQFVITKKAIWVDTFTDSGKEIDYRMPYFDHVARFRDGDMIVIGGRPGVGKTHVALNMVKQLVEQDKKPYYIYLESGSRFKEVAMDIGLREGDFWNALHFNPQDIELEKNSITLVDWLLPDDYANTDKLYKHFAEQLAKAGGQLIIFVQLTTEGEFFAKNMIEMFPALAAKFMYEKNGDMVDRGRSKLVITKVRESKFKGSYINSVPLKYNYESKRLERVDDNGDTPTGKE